MPGGGGKGCDWMVPPPGRLEGGRLIGAGSGCGGGSSACGFEPPDGGALGTSAGGRGGSSRKIEPNCAEAGVAISSAAIAGRQIDRRDRAIRSDFAAWITKGWILCPPTARPG
jgi:hypothetical protein